MKYIYIFTISILLLSCSTNNSLKSIDAVGNHVYEHMTNADNISYNEYFSSFITPEEVMAIMKEGRMKDELKKITTNIKEWNSEEGIDEENYNKLKEKIKNEKEYGITHEFHDFKVSSSKKRGGITMYEAKLYINYFYPEGGSDDDRAVELLIVKTNHEEFHVMGYHINFSAGEPSGGF